MPKEFFLSSSFSFLFSFYLAVLFVTKFKWTFVQENKHPAASAPQEEDFPTLGGSKKKLGATFIKAEDKLVKKAPVKSQWANSPILVTYYLFNTIKVFQGILRHNQNAEKKENAEKF